MSLDICFCRYWCTHEYTLLDQWSPWQLNYEVEVRRQIGSLFAFEKLEAGTVPVAILLGCLTESALELADIVPSTVRTVELKGNLSESEERWIHPVWYSRLLRYTEHCLCGASDAAGLRQMLDVLPPGNWDTLESEVRNLFMEGSLFELHQAAPGWSGYLLDAVSKSGVKVRLSFIPGWKLAC